ncbi:glutaminyl-peptide cyclotransferase [Oceanisphaera pacifica]|uniref:Glutaminyl-peptide cyclotransferase n=1 Tax=Oceanisphaera pacifica TaxID=2818389 RepID=A0ABS3NII4_9GAMM|nr:glutaminyl-peptide cyclotransferase [Oceanisphaera pacifica]
MTVASPARAVEQLGVKVIERLPHDANAFTQGLHWHQGVFYESTGLYGASSLRKVNPLTGEVLASVELERAYFGEGLARVGQQLIQLTWRKGLALVYDLESLALVHTFEYSGEGWGLCFDGDNLWMSDGSSRLYQRDPHDFTMIKQLNVTLNKETVPQLNELACVGEHIYANVWKEPRLVRINKATGQVDAEIDASHLVAESGRRHPESVLNGITYDEQAQVFYLTGKRWPTVFKVQWQAPSKSRKP